MQVRWRKLVMIQIYCFIIHYNKEAILTHICSVYFLLQFTLILFPMCYVSRVKPTAWQECMVKSNTLFMLAGDL